MWVITANVSKGKKRKTNAGNNVANIKSAKPNYQWQAREIMKTVQSAGNALVSRISNGNSVCAVI